MLHAAFGKCSFPTEHLYANLGVLTAAVLGSRPKGLKGGGEAPRAEALPICIAFRTPICGQSEVPRVAACIAGCKGPGTRGGVSLLAVHSSS